MRQSIKDFVALCAESLKIQNPLYEFGSLQVPGQEGFADLRPLFAGIEYYGADIRNGRGVDRILDLHDINLPSGSAGTVLVMDTLEHVEYPRKAVEEVYRILKPDGILIMSSVMEFPIHDCPNDFWRFTPAGFSSLLKIFEESVVDFAGEKDLPHTVVGIGFKRKPLESLLQKLEAELSEWRECYYVDR